MSSTSQLMPVCKRCSREIAPGALACENCHALVNSDQLDRISARARALEANGSLHEAHEQWQMALQLLPSASEQANWIRSHLRELEQAINTSGDPHSQRKWAKRLGPLGPVAILLAKLKPVLFALSKLKFLFSFLSFIAIYWAIWGPWFGIGFAVLILVHEMGHFIEIRRRGLPAELPVFLPGFGAYVRWDAMGVSLETRSIVSLAGPFAGWIGAAVCGLLWWQTGNQLWAALARFSAWINILNLIPVWTLDGSSAIRAMSKLERAVLLIVAVGLGWGLHEYIFYIVAAGVGWRLFTRDDPPESSPLITAYFIAVLALLGLTVWMMPGHGPAVRYY